MTEEKATQIITFLGKKSNWRQWSQKFLAVLHRRGFRDYLDGTKKITSTKTDDNKKLNIATYNDLLLSMSICPLRWMHIGKHTEKEYVHRESEKCCKSK